MSRSIYLVNPTADFPTYFGAEMVGAMGLKPATAIADLATPTVAAMAPEGFDVTICDENMTPIDFDVPTDFVAITGKVSQWGGREIVRRLTALGPDEATMAYRVFGAVSRKPQVFEYVRGALFHYVQIRHMYAQGQFWDRHVAEAAQPF